MAQFKSEFALKKQFLLRLVVSCHFWSETTLNECHFWSFLLGTTLNERRFWSFLLGRTRSQDLFSYKTVQLSGIAYTMWNSLYNPHLGLV